MSSFLFFFFVARSLFDHADISIPLGHPRPPLRIRAYLAASLYRRKGILDSAVDMLLRKSTFIFIEIFTPPHE